MIGILCGLKSEADILTSSKLHVYTGIDGYNHLHENIKHYDKLISFGTCGGLSPALKVGDIVVSTSVVTSNDTYTSSDNLTDKLVGLYRTGTVFSDNIAASTPSQRADLFSKYRGIVIDQESYKLAKLATTHKIPFIVIRSVSDDYSMTLPSVVSNAINLDGSINYLNVIGSIIKNPFQVNSLISVSKFFNTSIQSLTNFYKLNQLIIES
jgi:hypothetical protein